MLRCSCLISATRLATVSRLSWLLLLLLLLLPRCCCREAGAGGASCCDDVRCGTNLAAWNTTGHRHPACARCLCCTLATAAAARLAAGRAEGLRGLRRLLQAVHLQRHGFGSSSHWRCQ